MAAHAAEPTVLLCVSPPNESLSFQDGFLGVRQASIKGEVQLKLPSSAPVAIDRVEVLLLGIERSRVAIDTTSLQEVSPSST
jgi:hypothetical protein